MSRSNARRIPKGRPLLDPKRAPYVKRVLLKKQLAAEQAACSGADPEKHASALAHMREALALLEGDE